MLRRVWLPVTLLALVALIPTWRFVFGGMVPAPVDQVHQLPPWNGPAPETPWDVLQVDGALQFLPWRDFMLDSFRRGVMPLWNPYSFGGAPFLANSQSAPLYPLHWLWPFDAESLLSFSAWLHLFIAGVGVFLLCRRLGASVLGGLVGGCSISLCAFMVAWLQLPSVGMTAAWIPWGLLGVLRAFEEPSAKSIAKLAAPVGLMLLAGHLQIAFYGLLAVALYALWLWAMPPKQGRHGFALSIAGLALGGCLAAPQVLPTLENGAQGHRAAVATEQAWTAYKGGALTAKHLAAFVTPRVFGEANVAFAGSEPPLESYWLGLDERGRNYAELAFYVGPIVLPLAGLALFALRRKPQALFFGVLALVGFAIAMGTLIAKALFDFVPGWSATGSPGRAAILCAMGLCVLAGAALREEEVQDSWVGPVLIGAVFAILGIGALMTFDAIVPGDVLGALKHSPVDGSWQLAVAAAVAVAALLSKKFRPYAVGGLLMLQVFTLANVHAAMNPGSPRGLYNQPFEGLATLRGKTVAVVNSGWSLFSAPKNVAAPPNSLLPYGIREVGGYDSIIRRLTKEKLDAINGEDSAPAANGNMLFIKPGFDPEKLRRAGVDCVISALTLRLPVEYQGPNWAIYSLPGPKPHSCVTWVKGNLRGLSWWGQDREEARAWLQTADADGWELDETTFDLSTKTIVTEYRPHSFRLGILLGFLGVSAVVALSLIRGKQ